MRDKRRHIRWLIFGALCLLWMVGQTSTLMWAPGLRAAAPAHDLAQKTELPPTPTHKFPTETPTATPPPPTATEPPTEEPSEPPSAPAAPTETPTLTPTPASLLPQSGGRTSPTGWLILGGCGAMIIGALGCWLTHQRSIKSL